MNAVSLGVVKAAMVDGSSPARLAAGHPSDGAARSLTLSTESSPWIRHGVVTAEILHIDGGQSTGDRDPY